MAAPLRFLPGSDSSASTGQGSARPPSMSPTPRCCRPLHGIQIRPLLLSSWPPACPSATRRGGAAERARSSRPSARGRRWCNASITWCPWTLRPMRSSRRGHPRPWCTPSARCPTSPALRRRVRQCRHALRG
ncbi:hypothetical protein PVAP13_6NG363375 [Panicum virgatum]|uniref:Uncharacterized protein n=1 Tax=Panicum virgatum TaxID=38727 RepID=A0A8T0R550_PANVG|nr:hypothetical protein PVAP13_6NG363375 [Panicum virgatum]